MASLSRSLSMPNISAVSSTNNTLVELNMLRLEDYRRETFAHENWPKAQDLRDLRAVRQLAEHGFYYTGVAVLVKCVFCLRTFSPGRWDPNADPDMTQAHFDSTPVCPFTRGFPCGNIPINPGRYSDRAYENMPAHLVTALEFELTTMLGMESSMPRDYVFVVDPDSDANLSTSDDDDLDSSFEEHYF
jgi:hypothetical protein